MDTNIQAKNILALLAAKGFSVSHSQDVLSILETELGFAYQQGQIANQCSLGVKLDIPEITNQIYDTLSGNGGMSEHHVIFNPERVTQGECDYNNGVIVLQLDEGEKNIRIKITDAETDYFSRE